VTTTQFTELTDATPPPHYGKFVADYRTPAKESPPPKSAARRRTPSPNRATRLIANAELYNPPFVRPSHSSSTAFGRTKQPSRVAHTQESSPLRVSGRGAVRQTVSSAGNSVNYTLTAALQNRHLQQPPVCCNLCWPLVFFSHVAAADQPRLPQAHAAVLMARFLTARNSTELSC
jgi:hypothetical protein